MGRRIRARVRRAMLVGERNLEEEAVTILVQWSIHGYVHGGKGGTAYAKT